MPSMLFRFLPPVPVGNIHSPLSSQRTEPSKAKEQVCLCAQHVPVSSNPKLHQDDCQNSPEEASSGPGQSSPLWLGLRPQPEPEHAKLIL